MASRHVPCLFKCRTALGGWHLGDLSKNGGISPAESLSTPQTFPSFRTVTGLCGSAVEIPSPRHVGESKTLNFPFADASITT